MLGGLTPEQIANLEILAKAIECGGIGYCDSNTLSNTQFNVRGVSVPIFTFSEVSELTSWIQSITAIVIPEAHINLGRDEIYNLIDSWDGESAYTRKIEDLHGMTFNVEISVRDNYTFAINKITITGGVPAFTSLTLIVRSNAHLIDYSMIDIEKS